MGKSTLIGKLIEVIRQAGRSVAVLACDPQSPLTGGALLGDRIRMPNRPDDDAVFIRSLATPSGHSGVAPNVDLMIGLFGRFGFDTVIVETVGAGQGDTAIREVADVVIVLVQPETGDELQWEKAGQLEIADIVVVHKADLPERRPHLVAAPRAAQPARLPAGAGRAASARARGSAWRNFGPPFNRALPRWLSARCDLTLPVGGSVRRSRLARSLLVGGGSVRRSRLARSPDGAGSYKYKRTRAAFPCATRIPQHVENKWRSRALGVTHAVKFRRRNAGSVSPFRSAFYSVSGRHRGQV